MVILQEILTWARTNLTAWQQDAVARLYVNRTLLASDLDDLYALAKLEHGIPDPSGRSPKALSAGVVAAPTVPNRLVQLVSIKCLSNVNALADGMELPIAADGLTVIYGENGAGKSGYSRILKRACRARDQREPILADARKEPAKGGPASATFATLVDGQAFDFPWSSNMKDPPEQLSELAIFDSHCARAYLDNQGDFKYVPYGLDILAGLVSVCNTVKERARIEKQANVPNTQVFASLAATQTEVGRALSRIPGVTTASDIEKLAAFSGVDAQRLETLTKALAEADPKQKAAALRLTARRFTELASRISAAFALVADDKAETLKNLIDAQNGAKRAAELAATQFHATPGLLSGTGTDEWKMLFEAAKQFALIANSVHGQHGFRPDSSCPLCQMPLGEVGAERMNRFEAFIGQTTEQEANRTRKVAIEAYRAFAASTPTVNADGALQQELSNASPGLVEAVSSAETALQKRHGQILAACGGTFEWTGITPAVPDPRETLCALVRQLQTEATTLEASSDENARSHLNLEKAELLARSRLLECKTEVLDAISKCILTSRLEVCMASISTTGMSRKSTELSKTMARQEVADALNAELKSLKVDELQVVMHPESPGGKTQFKLALQLPGGGTPSAILSEGEQRAIAIAAFLTEVRLGGGLGGVVFDDPVSSLDHHRRWEVARRLAVEAHSRQVIVFTHDIYFLCILKQIAEDEGTPLATRYICRTAAGFGVHHAELPFDIMTTKARIGTLRNQHVHLHKAHKAGDMDTARRLTRELYRQLRMTWERAVEEVLLDGVVQRFEEPVHTRKLRRVTVENSDYATIEAGMTKSSKFEHDAAATIHLPTPHPDDVKEDIDRLDNWRNEVEARKLSTASHRG